MKKIIIGNWKMHPLSFLDAKRLFIGVSRAKKHFKNVDVMVAPPFVYLEPLIREARKKRIFNTLQFAAQDVFWESEGAYTGEISGEMVRHAGARAVIIGHSERRNVLGETDDVIRKKIFHALCAGLNVVLCVGESLNVRKLGMRAAKQFVEKQLMSDLKGIDAKKMRNIIVAYEPIWAIGTGKNETPEGAAHMVAAIKRFLLKTKNRSPKVLYGGSVNGRNISGFLREHAIDGVLVGGASIIPREFRSIIVSAAKHSKR